MEIGQKLRCVKRGLWDGKVPTYNYPMWGEIVTFNGYDTDKDYIYLSEYMAVDNGVRNVWYRKYFVPIYDDRQAIYDLLYEIKITQETLETTK